MIQQEERSAPPSSIAVESLEQWRKKLKLSDISLTAKEFYFKIQECHETKLTYHERIEVLNILRPTLNYLCQKLQALYLEQEVLSESQRLIADLVYALYAEMLYGYKLIIQAVNSEFFPNKKILLGSLQNAMHYCTKIIFHAYEQHRHPPVGVWLELHMLYMFAQKKNIENKTLPNVVDWHYRFNTISDLYKHCLLYAMSNPYRLRRKDTTRLLYALEAWAPLLIMQSANNAVTPLFILDVTSDSGPKYATLHFQYSKENYFLILSKIYLRLCQLLDFKQNNTNAKNKSFTTAELELPISIVHTLINSWNNLTQRPHPRQRSYGHITICVGITSCHWHILHQSKMMGETEEIAQDQAHESSTTSEPRTPPPMFECELLDQSEGGYCLKWPQGSSAQSFQLQCGEIIAFAKESPEGAIQWSVGTIRWLKIEEDLSVVMGMQILSTHALAVTARPTETTSLYRVPTLLFPEQPLLKKPMTLITPPLPFKADLEIELMHDSQNYIACLERDYSHSPSYQEFGIHFLSPPFIFPTVDIKSTDVLQQSLKRQ